MRIFLQENIQENLIAFSETVENVKNEGTNLVLLFDEFEELVQHRDAFPEDFFDQMRALINIGALGMVTSSQKPLRDLCLDGKLSSPFFNVFSRIDLHEFTEQEAEDFLITDWGIEPFSEDERSHQRGDFFHEVGSLTIGNRDALPDPWPSKKHLQFHGW